MHGRLNSVKTRHASVMGALFYVMGITSAMAMPAPVENKTLPTQVEIFTTDAFPITGVEELKRRVGEKNVTVYALDGVDKAEKAYPILGAKTEAEAQVIGLRILNEHRTEIAARVYPSYGGLFRAAYAYQIKKYPAIIFDQRYVAYGETDAARALRTLLSRADYRRTP